MQVILIISMVAIETSTEVIKQLYLIVILECCPTLVRTCCYILSYLVFFVSSRAPFWVIIPEHIDIIAWGSLGITAHNYQLCIIVKCTANDSNHTSKAEQLGEKPMLLLITGTPLAALSLIYL